MSQEVNCLHCVTPLVVQCNHELPSECPRFLDARFELENSQLNREVLPVVAVLDGEVTQ